MSHKIELLKSSLPGARPTMFRGGIKFEVGQPQILNLTKDEVEVFENDWRFSVSSTKDSGATIEETKASERETVPSAIVDSGKEAVVSQAEIIKDSPVAQEEAVADEMEESSLLDTLLKGFSREELNEQAKVLGIEKPESFGNKTEVAQAIVDAQ